MSYLLMIFYWVGIPLLVLLATGWALRQAKTERQKKWIFAATAVVLLALLWAAGGEKAMVDAQVRKLCAQDGGIRVYETVKLPAERFNKYGNIKIPSKKDAMPSDEYYYTEDIIYFRAGSPDMRRSQTKIIRRSDEKMLGEFVYYSRRGGDMPGPWHASYFGCPDLSTLPNFEGSIFLKSDSK